MYYCFCKIFYPLNLKVYKVLGFIIILKLAMIYIEEKCKKYYYIRSVFFKKRGKKMSILTFKGGVHPYDGKELSKDKPVRKISPGSELVFPVSQHIGAPAVPIVEVGQRVLKGELIARAEGFVSANIHSSVSGTVKKIEKRLVPNGNKILSVIIENDNSYEEIQYEPLQKPWSGEDIREAIKKAGVVGLGGACFPTHVKLSPKDDSAIDYVIVNAAECEPYITSDYRRLVEQPQQVIEGLKIILQLFDNAKGVIAVENNKQDVIENLIKLTEKEDRIEVAKLKTKYPQGSERHIIYAITKRKLNSSMLPADAGCIVDNVDTVYNIYRAVKLGKPLTERIVTVSGDGVTSPCNLEVPFGTSHQVLAEEAGGINENVEKILSGGPMMGMAMFNLDVPVIKGSSALLAFKQDAVAHCRMTNCLNCGKCAQVCPEGLICAKIAQAAVADDMESFIKMHGMECIECGTCNYNCPANRNITQSVRTMKKKVQEMRRKG
jgi:electron transport complex protein RnfC